MTQPFRIKNDLYAPSDISSDGALIINRTLTEAERVEPDAYIGQLDMHHNKG
jgi:hypothetical protein